MRATLIHNPKAGDARSSAKDLREMLAAAGFQVRYHSSKKNWKKALQQPADLVVIAGGDGTVAKVLKELAGTGVAAAILPVGTANNIARTLGIAGDARDVVDSWHSAEPRPFDLGLATGPPGELRFVEAAGGGLFAAAITGGMEAVENAGAILGNETDRALVHLRATIENARPRRWRVEIDGADHSGSYLGVEVMNIRHAGPSVPIAPRARPDDGRLDVVMIAEGDGPALIDYIDQRLAQHEVPLPELTVVPGRRVRLDARAHPLRIDDRVVDGEEGRWDIAVDPGALSVLVSPTAVSAAARRSG